jgi:RNA polymerase sigma-70 factor (ECF subfamily)
MSAAAAGKKNDHPLPLSLVGLPIPSVTVRASEEAAFDSAVVAPHAERLLRLALAVVDDPGEAQDAVQETLLVAWRHWSSWERLTNPSAWLTRVCVHQCVRRRRLLGRWVFWSPGRWAEEKAQMADLDEGLLDVQRAYAHLSPSQRAVLCLHLQDGLTVEDCAAQLGIRPGTARSHLGRALSKLRKELFDV